jgi:predicted XRE-type DNA-binding protein
MQAMIESRLYIKIKMLLLEQKLSETQIAKAIGMNQRNFNAKLNAGTLRYLEVEKLLEALGYEIQWIKKA